MHTYMCYSVMQCSTAQIQLSKVLQKALVEYIEHNRTQHRIAKMSTLKHKTNILQSSAALGMNKVSQNKEAE